MIYGPCRVPLRSGIGMARVTLSYPGWKEGNVTPVTVEVPVEPMSWRGLLLGYLIWPLGVAVIGVVAWVFWRARRRGALLRAVLRPVRANRDRR